MVFFPPLWRYSLIFLVCITCLACAARSVRLPKPPPRESLDFPLNYTEEGIASWYGAEFHGRRTANGEVYDMYKNSAAHRYLPLGCYARITNLKNQKSLIVKINDRGPFVKDRILDLSYGAACALGMAEDGLAPVRIELVRLPDQEDRQRADFFIQIGAFLYQANADRLQQQLSPYYPIRQVVYQRPDSVLLHRVWVGPFSRIASARKTLRELEAMGYTGSFIVAE
ncbi:MAG: septal ring lytic transglycosylase RlpA family protein [bacterium]|nr:septal ring lytic transglycosylase RlpA family protein [bacterium]